ncbi:MAG: winged helix-turn-helix domain-containing protein [Gammaproteobacteria bacterium]
MRQCQRLFRQMGFRLRKPRPVIAKADPAAQAAFKKTAAPGRRFKR